MDEQIDAAHDVNTAEHHETSNSFLVIEPFAPDVQAKSDAILEDLMPIDCIQTNEAHHTDETEIESLIYTQICCQETEMLLCSEKEIKIPIKFANESPGIIGACFSKPSSDCLYNSLTHQLS